MSWLRINSAWFTRGVGWGNVLPKMRRKIMNILTHYIVTKVIAIFLYFTVGWKATLFFVAGSFLLDIDHYLYYVATYKRFNPIMIHKEWERDKPQFARESIVPLHMVEFIVLYVILSFFSFNLLLFSLGALLHNVMDIYHEFFMVKIHKTHYSIFGCLITRKLKNGGLR